MKILFITPSPINDLNRIRAKNIIVGLKNLGHEITLITLYKSQKEFQDFQKHADLYSDQSMAIYHPVWQSLWNCLLSLFSTTPLRVAYCSSNKLYQELSEINPEKFDAIYIKRARLAQYADIFATHKKLFIDITDSMSKYYERLSSISKGLSVLIDKIEFVKQKKFEKKICNKYNKIIVCSNDDKNYIINRHGCPADHFIVMNNSINELNWKLVKKRKSSLNQLVFWGVMNVDTNDLSMKNFIKEIMPALANKYTLQVIGPKPSKSLIKSARNLPVKFLGHVDNVASIIEKSSIFICPIITGAGTKNKILQAALLKLPIISSDLGLEGLDNEILPFVYRANKPNEYVQQLELITTINKISLNKSTEQLKRIILRKYKLSTVIKEFCDTHLQS